MKHDRAFKAAMRIVGMSKAYRDAVPSIARVIRAEVRRAVKPYRDAIDACDWSYGRAQTDDVRQKIHAAMERDPMQD